MPAKNPRVNVTVTEEQHALLLELAQLNGGSAAGYLRQMLDHATPLLRASVPALRMAAQEMEHTREETNAALTELLEAIRNSGAGIQPDLIDDALAATRPQRREDGRGKGSRQA